MIGTFENPTLDLDPSKPDTLDVITATRSGVATYTDADGLIQSASADTVRVDYTQGEELTPTKYQHIGYTDFSSGRVLSNFGTGVTPVLSSDALGSPNGTEDAYKIVFNAGSGTTSGDGSELYFNASEIEDNIQSTASIYLRGENGGEQLIFRGASNGSYQLVTLTTEWQRFTTTESTSPSGNQKFTFGIRQSVSGHGVINSAATIYAYGPQLEEGTTASDFVSNTTGSPKFIASATYGPRVPMILVEPSATNLVEYSEDFSNSYWGKIDVSVSAAPITAPDGTMTAYHVIATGANAHIAKPNIGSQNTHKTSIWARTVSGSGTCFFNYHGGTPSTITEEWQRFEVTSNSPNMYPVNFRGSSTLTEIYIWGAQLETGSVATSYIPTSGSTVTRQADDLVISGSDFTDFYNQSEGTIYCEFEYDFEHAFEYIYNIRQDPNNEIRTQLTPTNDIRTRYTVADSHVAQPSPAGVVQGSLNRHAFSYKTNNFRGNVNGGSDEADLSGNASLTPVEMQLGGRVNVLETTKFKRLIYWPYHSDSL
jgi:hypothetical protein